MEPYNKLISSMLLHNVDGMIGKVPQPTMFGGKRQRDFVLPGSTDYDYPGSLAVGSLSKQAEPSTLGGTFWKDFGEKEFLEERAPDAYKLEGGKGGIGKELGMTVAKEMIKEGVKQGAKYALSGSGARHRRKETVDDVAHEIYRDVIIPEGKELLKMYIRSMITGEPMEYEGGAQTHGQKIRSMVGKKYSKFDLAKVKNPSNNLQKLYSQEITPKKRGRKPKVVLDEEELTITPKKRGRKPKVILEEEELTITPKKRGRKPKVKMFEEELTITPKKRGRKPKKIVSMAERYAGEDESESDEEDEVEGGALIRNVPSQYHSSVYPPALASYTSTVPYGHDAYGRGRAKTKPKRSNARGAIVKEVMKKHGLSLPEASKFVKANNLY